MSEVVKGTEIFYKVTNKNMGPAMAHRLSGDYLLTYVLNQFVFPQDW